MTATPTTSRNIARALGAIAGVGVAIFLVFAARPTANVPGLPAAVRVSVSAPGELAATPAAPAPVLNARALAPGRSHDTGAFELRNQTGTTLAVALRAHPDSTALDGLVRVRLSAGRKLLANTTLQGLRHPGLTSLLLPSGARRQVHIEAWIPRNVSSGYEGQQVAVSLDPVPTPVGS